jgi:hypothetical protein
VIGTWLINLFPLSVCGLNGSVTLTLWSSVRAMLRQGHQTTINMDKSENVWAREKERKRRRWREASPAAWSGSRQKWSELVLTHSSH